MSAASSASTRRSAPATLPSDFTPWATDGCEVDDGVDPIGCHAELEGQLDIAVAVQVDERVDRPPGAASRMRSATPSPCATGHDAVVPEPLVVRRTRQADHGGAGPPRQLHGERADAAGRRRHDHRVAGVRLDGADRRVRRGADNEQGAGDLPRDRRLAAA